MRRVLPLLLLAVASSAFAQDATLDPSRTVATVNGEPIKAGEYYRRLEWFRPDRNSALVNFPAGFQLLRAMISEKIILQLAKAKSVAPTTPEIDARVAELYRQNPGLKAELTQTGRTEEEVRAELASQEAQFKLVTAGITITDLEVETHYKNNSSDYRQPARYKIRAIAVGDDAGQDKVDAALKAGRAFADVAKEMSQDLATKARGGDYGDVSETDLSEATRVAVGSTAVGATTVWVRGENSTARVKFLVESNTPAKTLPLDPSLKAAIRRRLMIDRGNVRNPLTKDLEAATAAAKVTIAQPGFQALYSQLQDRVRKSQGQG